MARIILMEDDVDIRRAYAKTLRSAGHTVQEASNGHEGLQMLKQAPFDIAILDLMMPEIDGVEVLNVLVVQCPNLKTLVISSEAEVLPVMEDLGADQILPKPISQKKLLDTVDKMTKGG